MAKIYPLEAFLKIFKAFIKAMRTCLNYELHEHTSGYRY